MPKKPLTPPTPAAAVPAQPAPVARLQPAPAPPISVESAFASLVEKYLWAAPIVLFLLFCGVEIFRPDFFLSTPMIDLGLPSEKAIPQTVLSHHQGFPEPSDPAAKNLTPEQLARWKFRYAPTGTEFGAGIPYWIFRVFPKIFTPEFGGEGWEHFGFLPDNQDYYKERQGLPSGMVLSDTVAEIPFFPVGVGLKRVSLNCAACHRGGVDEGTGVTLIDGMPNHTADLQAFKEFMTMAVKDDRFNAPDVIAAINRELDDLKAPELTQKEEAFYTTIVAVMKRPPVTLPAGDWMASRPKNGPGRIDPFNSVKFEKMNAPDDHTDGTENFPAIWNQKLHSWHHFDGNTQSLEARNFGSALGVGAISLSIHRDTVRAVGNWIEDLPSPPYPFKSDPGIETKALVARGLEIYKQSCAQCHGIYDSTNRALTLYDPGTSQTQLFDKSVAPPAWSHYMKMDAAEVGTDDARLKAFDAHTAALLNTFGEEQGLWLPNAFQPAGTAYLCRPLDGIWARAPYLHNGSVPTLDDFLKPDTERPKTFYRGSSQYDRTKVGFISDSPTDQSRSLFPFDTSEQGNSNKGHNYPKTPLKPDERAALLEYLKTL